MNFVALLGSQVEDEGEERDEESRRESETPIRWRGKLLVEGKREAGGNPDVCFGLQVELKR